MQQATDQHIQPLISVIIRSIGRSDLKDALQSVAMQSYPCVEAIVVNAKGPGHPEVGTECGRFPLLLVETGAPLARSQAANLGLLSARGQYLIFLDDDDWFEPEHLQKLVDRMTSLPSTDVVYTGVICVNADKDPIGIVFEAAFDPARLISGNFVPIHSALFSRCVLDRGCRFDESLEVYEDWDFWLQLAQIGPFVFVPGVSAVYRRSGTSGVGLQVAPDLVTQARRKIVQKWQSVWSAAELEAALARSLTLEHRETELSNARAEIDRLGADRAQLQDRLSQSQHDLAQTQDRLSQTQDRLAQTQDRLASVEAVLEERIRLIDQLNVSVAELQAHLGEAGRLAHERHLELEGVYASLSWRLTAPLRIPRRMLDRAKVVRHAYRIGASLPGGRGALLRRALAVWEQEGLAGIKLRILRLAGLAPSPGASAVASNCAAMLRRFSHPDSATLARMRAEVAEFPAHPLISLIVPVYNTPTGYLTRMVDSVLSQVYPDWELCIADDASPSPEVWALLERFARKDGRIKIVRREVNGGISAASNSALALSTGQYVALLDHDDELAPDALYWVVKEVLAYPQADVLYSDEDRIAPDGSRTELFVKPDWSPELMYNCMYLGHLTVYSQSLLSQVGGFRSELDFSQDYDLALRATEVAREVRHIPRVLYHWRQAEGSGSRGDKPYARQSNLVALQAAIDRRGLAAEAVELPTANRVKFKNRQRSVSIIIPTDSEANLSACLNAIAEHTDYPALEIIAVTNSRLAGKLAPRYGHLPLIFSHYDRPYNFSDKCNAGVERASGEIVLFLNDDVRPLAEGWLEDTIELLDNPEVGAVAPKLLYEDMRIQHAGIVTGVRGLVGTAFHCLPDDTSDHFNFAQSVRDVSVLSGACLAMRRRDFLAVGGYDPINAPISHSDVDLCFKLRERGLRCVYTPHAKLLHIGHLSLKELDKKPVRKEQRKVDLFLLKRWGGYISYDPYFPDNMRDLLYRDSPEHYRIWAHNRPDWIERSPDVLLVTHDMSASGAPMVVYYAAKHVLEAGGFPVVASPEDGPLRARFEALDIPVIVDSLLLTRHESVRRFARSFDCVLANTIVSWPIVNQLLDEDVPVLWYLHECKLIADLADANPLVAKTLRAARHLYAGSKRSLSFCQAYNSGAKVLTYGVADIYQQVSAAEHRGPIVFTLFGSIEPRKGQDIFVEAARRLEKRVNGAAVFNIVGRTLDQTWAQRVIGAAKGLESVRLLDAVGPEKYLEMMASSDVIVCPSRDDTLPLVTLDALALGKTLICSDATGTSEFLCHGKDGLVVPSEAPDALAEAMAELIADRARLAHIGIHARQTFLRHFTEAEFGRHFNEAVWALACEPCES